MLKIDDATIGAATSPPMAKNTGRRYWAILACSLISRQMIPSLDAAAYDDNGYARHEWYRLGAHDASPMHACALRRGKHCLVGYQLIASRIRRRVMLKHYSDLRAIFISISVTPDTPPQHTLRCMPCVSFHMGDR